MPLIPRTQEEQADIFMSLRPASSTKQVQEKSRLNCESNHKAGKDVIELGGETIVYFEQAVELDSFDHMILE